jgi:hypothetical protein
MILKVPLPRREITCNQHGVDQRGVCKYLGPSLRLLHNIPQMSNEIGVGVRTYDEQSRFSTFTIKHVVYARVPDTPRIARLDLFPFSILVDPPKFWRSLSASLSCLSLMYLPDWLAICAARDAPAKASSVPRYRSRKRLRT